MNYYTKKSLSLMEEVIAEHAPRILKELGMEDDNDGILNRITVSSKIGDNVPHGEFTNKYQAVGIMGLKGMSYVKGSGSINLHPLTIMQLKTKKGIRIVPFASAISFLFSKALKKTLIFVLAHEMRHYWQFYTNTAYKKGGYLGSTQLIPYHLRWEEIDANDWAKEYVSKLK